VNNIRGFRMRNALGKVFTGLDGRDDPVLENANGPVSCRLLVRSHSLILMKKTHLDSYRRLTSSLDTQSTPHAIKCELDALFYLATN